MMQPECRSCVHERLDEDGSVPVVSVDEPIHAEYSGVPRKSVEPLEGGPWEEGPFEKP